MDTTWLNDEEMAAWVRLAAVLELLPGVLDSQLRRDAELTHFEYYARPWRRRPTRPCPGSPT